ncbi:hypothetical protein SDC9_182244 [bioreactor metagenome]|uniref:Uncharacterized protein n=1 Tax=bioreactor metagenome TaxID=1076179 RepID=A0A645H7U3_9ZZZZ
MGVSRNGGAHHVADTEDECSFFPGQLHGCQRIGGFSRLGDGDDDIILMNYRLTVAKLGRVLHLHRDTGKLLDSIHAYLCRMPGGSTGGYDDAAGI